MRRLLSTLFAVAALAGPLAGGAAHAQDGDRHDHGRGREERGRGYEHRDERGGRYDGPPPSYDRRPDDRGHYEGERGRMGRDYGPPPAAGPALGYEPPAGRSVRRGGYMPPAFHGAALGDYGRYRLRPPPRGYAWYRVGGGYALVSIYTGQIFDMIPD